jgi:uncharacterized membrane protein YjgN (DUF898 family)
MLFVVVAKSPVLGIVFLYFVLFAMLPLIVHGSLRYRMSRTSYQGIRFGYRGNRKELSILFFKDVFFTIISFGIYSSWLFMNLRAYTHRHVRYGNVTFSNEAKGSSYFLMNLKGYFLTIITLGIYSFWWQKDIFNYYIDHMKLQRDSQQINFHSSATGFDFFKLLIGNFFLIFLTLGIASAWVQMRTLRFVFSHIKMTGDIDLSTIAQTEEQFQNALGDDAMDFFNIDII